MKLPGWIAASLVISFVTGCADGNGSGVPGTDGSAGGAGAPGSIEGLQAACVPAIGTQPGVPCPGKLTCGTGGEQSLQCVIEGCPTLGPGPAHGCPVGAFCNVFDGNDGHFCVRVCEIDADCGNPALRCVLGSSSQIFGLKICVGG